MMTKRLGILAGTALAGTLLLGTAGLVAAQDPTPTPSSRTGAGMMGGAGMTSAQLGQMDAIHNQMVANGARNPARMQQLHAQHHPGN